jgi:hypothetical protein
MLASRGLLGTGWVLGVLASSQAAFWSRRQLARSRLATFHQNELPLAWRQIRWSRRATQIEEMCPALCIILPRWPLLGVAPPTAIISDVVKNFVQSGLWPKLCRKTGKSIFTFATTKIAADADDHPREFGEPFHHSPLLAVKNIIRTRWLEFQERLLNCQGGRL